MLRRLHGAEGKRVALAAWRALQGGHRGGPELTLADACLLCLDAKLQGIAAAQDASQVSVEPGTDVSASQYVWLCHGIVSGVAEERQLPAWDVILPGSAMYARPAPGTKALQLTCTGLCSSLQPMHHVDH